MGYFLEHDEANNVLRITCGGVLKDELLKAAVAEGRRFLASHQGSRAIADFSGVTDFGVSTETIRAMAWEKPHGEETAVVVIVAPGDLVFGLSRMFSIHTEPTRPNRHVVRTIEKAYELLEIRNPQFSRIELT